MLSADNSSVITKRRKREEERKMKERKEIKIYVCIITTVYFLQPE